MRFNRVNVAASLPMLVVGGMVVIALAAALGGISTPHVPMATPDHAVASRDLRFEDRADGAVMIFDAGASAPFQVVEGQAGFLRGTLRGLARTRRSEGLDNTQSFHLAAWPDGRLTLDDPATGRRIELEAFGSLNEAVFAHFLPSLGDGK